VEVTQKPKTMRYYSHHTDIAISCQKCATYDDGILLPWADIPREIYVSLACTMQNMLGSSAM
jgi:hypothetical protein